MSGFGLTPEGNRAGRPQAPQDGTLDSPEGRWAGESPQETCVGAWAPWTDSGGNCLLLSS